MLADTGTQTTAAVTYGYDADNDLTSKDVTLPANPDSGLHAYGYDNAGRITSWNDGTTATGYSWDGAGNRTAAGTNTYTYDERNRMVEVVDTIASGNDTGHSRSFVYDAHGSMTSATKPGKKNGPWAAVTWTWDWDALGRLVDYNGEVSYTYDGLNRIATRGMDAFTYDGFGLDPTSTGSETYSRTPGGRLIGITDTTASSLVGLDRHGDLTHLFDPTGAVSDTAFYDPFGDLQSATGTFMPQVGFQGDYTDPTSGRVWMGARWYDAGWANFLSRDTIFGELTTPVSLNRYTYAGANPMSYWDPDGQQFTCLAIDGLVCATASQEVKQETLTHTSTVREYVGSQTTYTQDTPQTADQGADQTATQTGNDAVVSGATPDGWAPSDGDANIVWCAYATYSCPGGGTAPVRVVLDGFTRFSAQATDAIANNVEGVANFAVDIIPGVGDLKAFVEALAGTDVLGRPLTPGQRVLIAGAAIFSFGNEAKAAIRHADELLDATRAIDDVLPKPVVSDPKLQNIVHDLYRGTTNPNRVGTGTTADAVRNELATGLPTGGTFHSEKAQIYINGLNNVLKTDLSANDRLVAQSLLDDLANALGGAP